MGSLLIALSPKRITEKMRGIGSKMGDSFYFQRIRRDWAKILLKAKMVKMGQKSNICFTNVLPQKIAGKTFNKKMK